MANRYTEASRRDVLGETSGPSDGGVVRPARTERETLRPGDRAVVRPALNRTGDLRSRGRRGRETRAEPDTRLIGSVQERCRDRSQGPQRRPTVDQGQIGGGPLFGFGLQQAVAGRPQAGSCRGLESSRLGCRRWHEFGGDSHGQSAVRRLRIRVRPQQHEREHLSGGQQRGQGHPAAVRASRGYGRRRTARRRGPACRHPA